VAGAAATRVLADGAVDLDALRADLDGTVLGFEVWACDPALTAPELERSGVRPATLEELLGACDVVSLHAPLTAQSRGLIGADELARMPPGALLVNTARAALVDTAALLDALAAGRLGGAALDVLDVEPPTAAHPAPRAPNLIVTPHCAHAGEEAGAELQRRVGAAIRAVLERRAPAGVLVRPSRR
jgi:phosphoglycerate dehydrogenase-like enzyme